MYSLECQTTEKNFFIIAKLLISLIRFNYIFHFSWHGDDESGMVVTEVHMLSGYVPEETEKQLLQRYQRKHIARVEIKDKSVIFYRDKVGNYHLLDTHR